MTSADLRTRLAEIARDVFEDGDLQVTDATSRDDVKAWDSLGHIRLVAGIEDAFGVSFTIDEIENVRTMGEFAVLIEQKA